MQVNVKTLSTWLFVGMLVVSCEDTGVSEIQVHSDDESNPLTTARTQGGYTFDGTEGDPIPLESANRWIGRFHEATPTGTQAHFFGNELIEAILAQKDCKGIRIYYGIDDDGNRQLILVGAKEDGSNLIPSYNLSTQDEGGIIGDASYPCPTYCNPPGGSL